MSSEVLNGANPGGDARLLADIQAAKAAAAAQATFPPRWGIDRDTPEWTVAWDTLNAVLKAGGWGDRTDECPLSGECWQYMGSGGDAHEFRHRMSPVTGYRTYVRLGVGAAVVIIRKRDVAEEYQVLRHRDGWRLAEF